MCITKPTRSPQVFLVCLLATTAGALRAAEPVRPETNAIGMRLIRVPAGEFTMGENDPVAGEKDDPTIPAQERLRHRVRIARPFDLGQYEVTIGQFAQFVAATGYRTEGETNGTAQGLSMKDGRVEGTIGPGARLYSFLTTGPGFRWREAGFPMTDEHPVVNVTHADAIALCKWLGDQEGATYRLPTEAEWEYACRAGTSSRYSFGDDGSGLARHANVADLTAARLFPLWEKKALQGEDGFAFTAPVGGFTANAWGLHDMHGNVWEWCGDLAYRPYPPQGKLVVDPAGAETGDYRVVRGGGWTKWAGHARSAKRYRHQQAQPAMDIGLRVVREIAPKP